MTKKTESIVTLTDDLDGTKADRTVAFSFEGANYEIELSKRNAGALEKALQPYITAARKVRASATTRSRTAGTGTRNTRSDPADVRAWAKANGITVSERGRVAQTVQDAYEAAH
jgi:hypothetical protein